MNLVLGAIRSLEIESIAPFFVSLRRCGFDGIVAVFASRTSPRTLSMLRDYGVEIFSIDESSREADVQINCLRYFAYEHFLQRLPVPIDRVLLSDVRDVVFQRDPFTFAQEGALCGFMEASAATINRCHANTGWIAAAYGKAALDSVSHMPIVCSGTTIGTLDAVRAYLHAMTGEMSRINDDIPSLLFVTPGIDQGIHNYLIHTGRLDGVQLFPNETGPILTMNYVSPDAIRLDNDGLLLNETGSPYHVVHQYDRHPALAGKVLARLQTQ